MHLLFSAVLILAACAAVRAHWSAKGNITHDVNIKTDTFTTANAARVGNWPWLYQVGCSGNLWADSGNGFDFEFEGLRASQPSWTSPNPNTLFLFKAYAAYNGTGTDGTAGAGGGDYRLQATSPAVGLARDWVLPYDISGIARGSTSASGAYHFGATSNFFQFFQ